MLITAVQTALMRVTGKGQLAPDLLQRFQDILKDNVDSISPYGYLRYIQKRYPDMLFRNIILSSKEIQDFYEHSQWQNDYFATSVIGIVERIAQLIDHLGKDHIPQVIEKLDDMAPPAILLVSLWIVCESYSDDRLIEYAKTLEEKAREYFLQFPHVKDKLPQAVKEKVEKVEDGEHR